MWFLILVAAAAAARARWGPPEPARTESALAFAPGAGLLIVLAVSLGLWDRRRLRAGARHASPSAAWIAKRLALAALGAAVLYGVSAILWPAWFFYASCLLFAAGIGLYLTHLPTRL